MNFKSIKISLMSLYIKCEAGHLDTCHVSRQAAITGKRPSKNVTVG